MRKSGLTAARHEGCRKSKSEILCFVDDDVEFTKTWFESTVNVLKIRGFFREGQQFHFLKIIFLFGFGISLLILLMEAGVVNGYLY